MSTDRIASAPANCHEHQIDQVFTKLLREYESQLLFGRPDQPNYDLMRVMSDIVEMVGRVSSLAARLTPDQLANIRQHLISSLRSREVELQRGANPTDSRRLQYLSAGRSRLHGGA